MKTYITKRSSTILYVTPLWLDQDFLRSACLQPSSDEGRWNLVIASSMKRATKVLSRHQIPLVICERDLQPGTWRDLLEETAVMPHSPLMIVTSRLADER